MHVSLSELSATTTKAAVAAGLDQGTAVALAKVACFSARYQIGDIACVARTLAAFDQQRAHPCIVEKALLGEFKSASEGALSVATITAPLRDSLNFSQKQSTATEIRITGCDQPELVLLIARHTAAALERDVWCQIRSDQQLVVEGALTAAGLNLFSDAVHEGTVEFQTLQIVLTLMQTAVAPLPAARKLGVDIETDTWGELKSLADRLLVPATDETRLSGAGAGLVEHD